MITKFTASHMLRRLIPSRNKFLKAIANFSESLLSEIIFATLYLSVLLFDPIHPAVEVRSRGLAINISGTGNKVVVRE